MMPLIGTVQFFRILKKHLGEKNIEKENSHELQASINRKKSIINVLLFASLDFS